MTGAVARPHGSELVARPLAGVIVRLALPAVGSALLQLVFLLIDTFWVGRILGAAAIAAISTAGMPRRKVLEQKTRLSTTINLKTL